jgi:glucarate dehydratase
MHSNSHLWISLAAMMRLAAATPNVTCARDTYWPWKAPSDDVVTGVPSRFEGRVTGGPFGAGTWRDAGPGGAGRMHETCLACRLRNRDGSGYMSRVVADWERVIPRW